MTDNRHISQEDLTLYAMQALAPEEVSAIEAHLKECPGCREELSVLLGDLALLGLSVEQQPVPQGAYERLRTNLTPASSAAGASASGASLAVDEGAVDEDTERTAPSLIQMPAKRRIWPVIIPWAIAASLTLGCIKLGVDNRNLNDAVHDESTLVSNLAAKASRAQQVLDVLNAPNAKRVTLTTTKAPPPSPNAHAIYLQDRGALLFQANNLKPIPGAKTYQLWVIPANGKAPISAGTFRPDANGYASVVLPDLPAGVAAKAFGVTLEDAGGAASPTMPILLSGE